MTYKEALELSYTTRVSESDSRGYRDGNTTRHPYTFSAQHARAMCGVKDAQRECRLTTYIVILLEMSLRGTRVMCMTDIYLIYSFRQPPAQLRLHFL
jgi:hypothetical protein